MAQSPELDVAAFKNDFGRLMAEVAKVIVGQHEVVEQALIALIAGGHVLLEGVPGLGKTLLVKTMADALSLSFGRIQFTPDLMPADIVGTRVIVESDTGAKEFVFRPGPVFCHILLADEINRATPKTQSALLEAMQEQTVTVFGESHKLPHPFLTLATQNPMEQEGTYPLPEAQLDRFFFKVLVPRPGMADMMDICDRTTGVAVARAQPVMDGPRLLQMRDLSRRIPVPQPVKSYAVRVVLNTQPGPDAKIPSVKQYVRYGSSPRGAQALILAAKVRALLSGRMNVAFEDVKALAKPVLRHRTIVNFEAEAEGISSDRIIEDVLAGTREVGEEVAAIANDRRPAR
ncbi:MAG TPA: MoxR family ATPase [bacterium]|nr:MoxR family ATPase [bacterium]